jgi:hypothetical protein
LGFIAVRSAFCTPVCMTTIMEKHLSNESHIDKYLLMDADPRWQEVRRAAASEMGGHA